MTAPIPSSIPDSPRSSETAPAVRTDVKLRDGLLALSLADLAFLEALVRCESLTLAAAELGFSKAAASRALARLREATNDQLFVRSNPRFIPTATAKRAASAAARMLAIMPEMRERAAFSPAEMTRNFVVGAGENAAYAFCVPVIERLFHSAPHAHITVRHFDAASVFDLLADGTMDMAFLPLVDVPPAFRTMAVTTNNILTVVRAGHPLLEVARERVLTSADLQGWRRVRVEAAVLNLPSSGVPESVAGFYRAVNTGAAATVPYFLTALDIIAHTDALLTVAKRTAERLIAGNPGFAVLPFGTAAEADYPVRIIWHRRVDDDPEVRWLRGLFRATLSDLDAPSTRTTQRTTQRTTKKH